MKQLLVDYMPFIVTPEIIKESITKNNGRLIVSGPLQRANAFNQNKRIYPRDILLREVNKYQNFISEKRALGELDHPESPVVNLSNVSHNILKTWWEGDTIMGKVEILDTPSGNILKKLFEAGIRLGISSRGMGSVTEVEGEEGAVSVGDDFELICWDFVSNPSTHGAFMNLSESKTEIRSRAVCRSKVECLIVDILTDLNK